MGLKNKNSKGSALIYLIVIIAVFTMVMLPVVAVLAAKFRLMRTTVQREQAFQIAEAGINYYQWHLAHFPGDYEDRINPAQNSSGNPGTEYGPYLHDYYDKDTQQKIGQFSLEITAPQLGSSVIKIESTGWTVENPGVKRKVVVNFGKMSLAQAAILTQMPSWFYYSPQIFTGQVRSNTGIRCDVTTNSLVQSAQATYSCPSWQGTGCPGTKNGVWGSGGPTSLWQYNPPVPAVDFSLITSTFSDLQASASINLPASNGGGGGPYYGYSLVFNSNGTLSIYKVTGLASMNSGYFWDINMKWARYNKSTDYTTKVLQQTIPMPSDGLIFVNDDTWIEGTVRGRATVAVAKLPYNSGNDTPMVFIPNNIVYSAKDGTDSLGIIAQRYIFIGRNAPENLEIDAALIAQNGEMLYLYRYDDHKKETISIYGSIVMWGFWFDNFVWTDGVTDNVLEGYRNTVFTYDANLIYNPPPGFPSTANTFTQIDWTSD